MVTFRASSVDHVSPEIQEHRRHFHISIQIGQTQEEEMAGLF